MVKRLRHRPFTAVTRVRFPMGSPYIMPAVYFTAGIYVFCNYDMWLLFILAAARYAEANAYWRL